MARRTVISELRSTLLACTSGEETFERYRDDPVGFTRDLFGIHVWSRQAEVMNAIATGNRVTVRSGRRVGKSMLAAALALWFWATRKAGARVILSAPSHKLVQEVVWRDLRRLHHIAKERLGGNLPVLAATGLRADDDRQVIGITADRAENFQGLAAPGGEIFFIFDEASGGEERIFDALFGNLAGGGKVLLIGNPTKSTGYFRESHRSSYYNAIHISSLESPLITGEKVLGIEASGLANTAWLAEAKDQWGGPDGPQYRIHVLGEFVEGAEGMMFPPELVAAAEKLWESTNPVGPLVIGVDPAGDGSDGDQSAFVCRRGKKVTWLHVRKGLTPDAHLIEILGLIAEQRGGSWELPRIVLDRDGPIGAKVYAVLQGYLQTHQTAFYLTGIRGSENAKRRPHEIHHVRDEMWFALKEALEQGLAIPTNMQLQGDLAAIRFDKLVSGRATVIKKQIIRRELGRSPDLGDALALAAYEGPDWVDTVVRDVGLGESGHVGAEPINRRKRAFDPYGSGGEGGPIDPYG